MDTSTLHIWDTVAVRSEILTYGDGSARVEMHHPRFIGDTGYQRPMIATWTTEPGEDAAATVQEWISGLETYNYEHATN